MNLSHRSVGRHLLLVGLSMIAVPGHAGLIFSFSETGGTVVMTSSGVLDTTKLVSVSLNDGWGGTGTENGSAAGDIDIMGGARIVEIDTHLGFHAGTDASAITNPGGPFSFTNIGVGSTGNKPFTTYSGFNAAGFSEPGIGIAAADIVGGLWTPDQIWTYPAGTTFASAGLVIGDYLVRDAKTGESIDIRIGQVPEPSTLAILSAGLIGFCALRRRRQTNA